MSEKNISEIITMTRKEGSFNIGLGAVTGDLRAITKDLSTLHPAELNRLEGFRFDRRKHSYLLGRKAAKQAINPLISEQHLNTIHVSEGIFQFPVVEYLRSSHLQLSISHCENIGLALAYPESHPVGIDIEQVSEKSREALGTVINMNETSLVKNLRCSETEGLSLIWTIKEALSKIFRTGMMLDFNTLEVSRISQERDHFISEFKSAGQYKAFSYLLNGFAVSIVLPGRSETDASAIRRTLKKITDVTGDPVM